MLMFLQLGIGFRGAPFDLPCLLTDSHFVPDDFLFRLLIFARKALLDTGQALIVIAVATQRLHVTIKVVAGVLRRLAVPVAVALASSVTVV